MASNFKDAYVEAIIKLIQADIREKFKDKNIRYVIGVSNNESRSI